MELGRLRRGLGRATGARQHEGPLEKARRLSGQLGELALQRLELAGGGPGRSARQEQIYELEPGDDVRGSPRHHTPQQTLAALPLWRVGGPRRAPREGVQGPNV